MDRHDIAHYVIGAGAIALGAFALHDAMSDSGRISTLKKGAAVQEHVWPGLGDEEMAALASALSKLNPQPISVYCMAPTCGDLQDDLIEAFSTGGWQAAEGQAMGTAPAGIEMSPDSDAGRAVAKGIETAVAGRLKVNVADVGLKEWAIVIGQKP